MSVVIVNSTPAVVTSKSLYVGLVVMCKLSGFFVQIINPCIVGGKPDITLFVVGNAGNAITADTVFAVIADIVREFIFIVVVCINSVSFGGNPDNIIVFICKNRI